MSKCAFSIILLSLILLSCAPKYSCLEIDHVYSDYDIAMAEYTYLFLKDQGFLHSRYILVGYLDRGPSEKPSEAYLSHLKNILPDTTDLRVYDLIELKTISGVETDKTIPMVRDPKITITNSKIPEMTFELICIKLHPGRRGPKKLFFCITCTVSYRYLISTDDNGITTFCYIDPESHFIANEYWEIEVEE